MIINEYKNFINNFSRYKTLKEQESHFELITNFLNTLKSEIQNIEKIIKKVEYLNEIQDFNFSNLTIRNSTLEKIYNRIKDNNFESEVLKELRIECTNYEVNLSEYLNDYRNDFLDNKVNISRLLLKIYEDDDNELLYNANILDKFNTHKMDHKKVERYNNAFDTIKEIFNEIGLDEDKKRFIEEAATYGIKLHDLDDQILSWIKRNDFDEYFSIRLG